MRLKTKIKWKFYNSLLSLFILHKFKIRLQFTKQELLEIPFIKGQIYWSIKQLEQENIANCFMLKKSKNNEVSIYYINSNGIEKRYSTLCFLPNYDFNKSKFARWICL